MRKTLLLLSLFIATNAIGQEVDLDCQSLSARDIDGTARYVGLAGAMTAIGGDPSAVMDNPAGLGIYRHSEVMVTLGVRPETTMPLDTRKRWTSTHVDAKQISAVFALTNHNKTSGIVSNNFMIGFQRMKTYDSRYQISGTGTGKDSSLTHVAAQKASGRGITENMIANEGADASIKRWYENEEIGWLSGMMYHTYLINPNGTDTYSSLLRDGESYAYDMVVEELGHRNHFSVDYSMNISNRFYWGLGLNIHWLDYYKSTTYMEQFGSENFTNSTMLQLKGIGVNGSIGFLYRPVKAFRIGAGFQTPTIMKLQQATDGKIVANIEMLDSTGTKRSTETISKLAPYVNRYEFTRYSMPLQFSVSPAVQIGKYALIAFQYDLSHWKNTFDIHTFKVGFEGVIKDSWMVEAGYAYESSLLKKQPIYSVNPVSIRLDTDWRNIRHSHYASLGVGYHGEWAIVHAAYQCRIQNSDVYAHEMAPRTPMRTLTHSIVVTIAWHSL